ncbi:hypothetical protein GCM10009665_05110 [Kitasatospora nipponensis]|uniref:Uncharacterized protein n=1 Tax=Kitasatospora nipponensis TaxID=258049 RepID=A0ABN1VNG5_9ACTN
MSRNILVQTAAVITLAFAVAVPALEVHSALAVHHTVPSALANDMIWQNTPLERTPGTVLQADMIWQGSPITPAPTPVPSASGSQGDDMIWQ